MLATWGNSTGGASGGKTATLALYFTTSTYYLNGNGYAFASIPGLTVTRASTGYAQTVAGALVSFGNNVARITDQGLLVEQAATNLFLQSFTPATQTITLSATGNYTLSLWGTDSATVAAGTATITGAGTATAGSNVTFNCTATGTITVTVSGSPTAVQVEAGAFGTSPIPTLGASATRAADQIKIDGLSVSPSSATFIASTLGSPVGVSTSPYLAELSDGTTNNASILQTSTTVTTAQAFNLNGGSSTGGGVASGLTAPIRIAVALSTTTRASANGSAVVQVSAAVPGATLTRLGIGSLERSAPNNYNNGYLRKVIVYPTAFSDTQLRAASS